VSWREGCGGDLLRFGSCRSIGLLEQVVRVVGRMLVDQIGQWVGVDGVQFGFAEVGWM
jgi:hypothetical protein